MRRVARALLVVLALLAAQAPKVAGDEGVEQHPVETTKEYTSVISGTVIELSAKTLKQAMKAHKFLLVEFYAPWCGHCKTLEPEYNKAAEDMKDLDVDLRLAKVDVTRNPSVQPEYGVGGFPTLKWFVNGEPSRLSVDARTSHGLVEFCKKNTDGGPVASTERLKSYLDQYPFVAVAYVEKQEGPVFDSLLEAEADMGGHLQFVYITNASIAADMQAAVPSIVFYLRDKDTTHAHVYDGPLVETEGMSGGEHVTMAIRRHSTQTITLLNDDNSDELLVEDRTPKVLLFRSPGEISSEWIAFKQAAEELKHKYNFYAVVQGTNERLTRHVGLETFSDPPQPWIYVLKVSQTKRYRYEGEVTARGLSKFLATWEQGEVLPYYLSEPPPGDWRNDEAEVKTVVGKTFFEFAQQDKHVLLEFYAPWCGHCRALEPRYRLASQYLEHRYPGEFAFGKIDGSKNEVPDSQIQGFPTVWLYPKGKKTPPYPIDLSKESADVHLFVKSIRLACDKPKEQRTQEAEYVAAARRFKAAVRALTSSLEPAVTELTQAAARLEALVAKERKSEYHTDFHQDL